MKHSSFDATISAIDADTSALDVETSAFGAATSRSRGGHSMRRYRRSMRRRSRGVSFDIGDCGVSVTPQMCYRVTNHGDMSTFSKPVPAVTVGSCGDSWKLRRVAGEASNMSENALSILIVIFSAQLQQKEISERKLFIFHLNQ